MTAAAPAYRSPEWHEWRRHGLGASDLPTVMGVNPWGSEYELAAVKRGLAEPEPESWPMKWGIWLEEHGLDYWRSQNDWPRFFSEEEPFTVPRYPHLWATLDGRVPSSVSSIYGRGGIGIEVKASLRRWPGQEPPPYVVVQALAQMGLADLERVDVVRLQQNREPTIHPIERDEALITDILDAGEAWFQRYVLGDEMPPLDDSQAARRYLDSRIGTEEREATEEQARLMTALRDTRAAIDGLLERDKALVRDLKASMVDTGALRGPGFRVTWSPVKARSLTNWKAVAGAYRRLIETRGAAVEEGDFDLDAIESLHTTLGEPGTTFRPTWTEEADDDQG